MEITNSSYPIMVFYSKEDEGWIADVVDFEMCSAFGDTPEEAIRECMIALQGVIEATLDNRSELPVPRSAIIEMSKYQ